MKIPKRGHDEHKRSRKQKIINDDLDQQINSDDIISEPEQNNINGNMKGQYASQDYRTPEQIKIELAKKLIQKVKNGINKKKKVANTHDFVTRQQARKDGRKSNDDFFVADQQIQIKKNNNQQVNKTEIEDELGQNLKNQYLKSKNKLYIDQQQAFKKIKIRQSIAYKGHTKCITAIHANAQKIFSVSKDRSIIIWDRETQTKDFITMAKQQNYKIDHSGPILCMDYHALHQIIATAGEDGKIKLWDLRTKSLIQTLKGHRNTVNGIKFGFNSNNLCTVSSDRTMKQWDCAQRGIIQTYYGHNSQVLDVDCINQNDFLSSGNDHQNIIWRTQKQTQMIFQGHDYSIDRVRSINDQRFISASQDGNINLWSTKKKKPVLKHPNSHDSWIVSLDCIRQSNIFASGGCDKNIKVWSISSQSNKFSKIHEIKAKGIVTDLKINERQIIAASSDQHRLGRWLTTKVRNQIQVFKFQYQS